MSCLVSKKGTWCCILCCSLILGLFSCFILKLNDIPTEAELVQWAVAPQLVVWGFKMMVWVLQTIVFRYEEGISANLNTVFNCVSWRDHCRVLICYEWNNDRLYWQRAGCSHINTFPCFCFPAESKEVYKRQVLSTTSIAMAISLLGTLCMALYCRSKWEITHTIANILNTRPGIQFIFTLISI